MYERWTDRARQVMQLANELVRRRGHSYLGTEHLLLGILAEGSGVAISVLRNCKLSPRAIQRTVERSLERDSQHRLTGDAPMTRRLKNVFEHAEDERRALNHHYVGTEHLLLGLIREQHGLAGVLLSQYHLNLDAVRDEVQHVLGYEVAPFG